METFPVRWGKYVLLEHLASGGMAEIYLALQYIGTGGHRLAIIKRVRGGRENQKELRDLFKIEAQALISLHSPHIVQTYDVEIGIDSEPYLIMEFLDGLSLKKSIEALEAQALQKLPLAASIEICKQIALGLSAAHECLDPISGNVAPILHRDVSPHNIILTSSGIVKLIDFGVAKAQHLGSATAYSGQVKGKFTYMAPEQFQASHKLDARADLFCLGIILWELLSGKRLFGGIDENNKLAIEKYIDGSFSIHPLNSIDKSIDTNLSEYVQKVLSLDKNQRPISAKSIAAWLDNFQRTNQLPSGADFLKDSLSSIFGDLFFAERQRIQLLIENSKKVSIPDSNERLTTVSTQSQPQLVNNPKLLYSGLALILLSLAAVSFKVFFNNSSSYKSNQTNYEDAPPREVPPNDNFLSSEQRIELRKIIGEVMRIREDSSDSVKKTWDDVSNLKDKIQYPRRYRDAFLNIDANEKTRLIKLWGELLEKYKSLNSDDEKIKLLKSNAEIMAKFPPPRPKINSRNGPEGGPGEGIDEAPPVEN